MYRLSADSDFTSILEVWSSGLMEYPLSLIGNTDASRWATRPEWYDVLCTVGGDNDTGGTQRPQIRLLSGQARSPHCPVTLEPRRLCHDS